MTRSNAREIVLHMIFEMNATGVSADELLDGRFAEGYYETLAGENELYEEKPNERQLAYIVDTLHGIERTSIELDETIRKYAVGWSLDRISKLARAVLQLAIYEMRYVDDVPPSSAINEAVELTRKYEDEDVVSFVNGILGSVSREAPEQAAEETAAEAETTEETEVGGEA